MSRLRKLMAALAILTLVSVPALAATYQTSGATGPSPQTLTIDPPGNVICPSGTQWALRSATSGFGFYDSTGTSTLRIYKAGIGWYAQTFTNVEHDGVTRTFYSTHILSADKFQVAYSGLASQGDAVVTAFCA